MIFQGGEFKGQCNKVFEKYGIKNYTTSDVVQKVAPVERSLLTVKQRLFKVMAAQQSWNWIDRLDSILKVLNHTYNCSICMTPTEVEKTKNQSEVFYNTITKKENLRLAQKQPHFKFQLGQVVRILKDQPYAKSYTGSYSNILYEICGRKIKPGGIPVYFLKELLSGDKIIGSFYEPELKIVDINRKYFTKIDKIHDIRLDKDIEQLSRN